METVITHPELTPGTFQKIILEVLDKHNALQYLVNSDHYFGEPEPGSNLWIGNHVYLKLPENYDTKQISKDIIFNIQKMEELYPDEIQETSWELIHHPDGYKQNKKLENTPNIYHIDIDIILKALYIPFERTATLTLKELELDIIYELICEQEQMTSIDKRIDLNSGKYYNKETLQKLINKLNQ